MIRRWDTPGLDRGCFAARDIEVGCRRCTATNTKGERCRSYAIPGAKVCRNHGGATRHVREAARVRLEMASNRLVGKLVEIAFDDTRPAAVQLHAIKDSLNRAGLTKPTQVEVGPINPFEQVFDSIASERVDSETSPVGSEQDSFDRLMFDQHAESVGEQQYSPEFEPPTQREPRTTTQPPTQHAAGHRTRDSEPLSADDRRVQRDRDKIPPESTHHRRGRLSGRQRCQPRDRRISRPAARAVSVGRQV